MANFTIKCLTDNVAIKLVATSTSVPQINLQYKLDSENNYHTYTLNTVINLEANQQVSFINQNDLFSLDRNNYYTFKVSGNGKIGVYGQLKSLAQNATTTAPNFNSLFKSCYNLIDAQNLIINFENIGKHSYDGMFADCVNLLTPPTSINAASIDEYGCSNMFFKCISMTKAPTLTAINLSKNAYASMFSECVRLTNPPQLPAITLADSCYANMFDGCHGLVNLSGFTLPAIVMAPSCYRGMFMNCRFLTVAPQLPATTLAPYCYMHMFANCQKLQTSPFLVARQTQIMSYAYMFEACSSLTKIKTNFKEWGEEGFENWVSGVSNRGTFLRLGNFKLPELRGNNFVSYNWKFV